MMISIGVCFIFLIILTNSASSRNHLYGLTATGVGSRDLPDAWGRTEYNENKLKIRNHIQERTWNPFAEFGNIFLDNSPSGKRKRTQQMRFLLGKKYSSASWQEIGNTGSGASYHWRSGGDVKILVHGWTPRLDVRADQRIYQTHMVDLGNAYRDHDSGLNVILVDWTMLSSYATIEYYQAANSVKYAADGVADFLIQLKQRGKISSFDQVHLIGFSLGGHVVGAAGQRLISRTWDKVGRITGIDPAGPLFTNPLGGLPNNRENTLDYSDAQFVDVIHCNMGVGITLNLFEQGLGTLAESGHADFYPNGGKAQPGCSFQENLKGCSHSACPDLFIRSINENMLACSCEDWDEYRDGGCRCTKDSGGVYFGDKTDSTASGKYYL